MTTLAVYALLAAAGAYGSYLAGYYVERSFGSQISLIFFLVCFMLSLIGTFPLALWLTAPKVRPPATS